jgi:hypothetical protein
MSNEKAVKITNSNEKINLISDLLVAYNNTDLIEILKSNQKNQENYDNQTETDMVGNAKSLIKLYGSIIYFIEALKFSLLPLNPYVSPYFTDEEVLLKFPKTYFLVRLYEVLS